MMSVATGENSYRFGSEVQQRRLPWAVLVLTLAAITSSSLSILSLYHILALKAEVVGLHAELSRRRQEQHSLTINRECQEPEASQGREGAQERSSSDPETELRSETQQGSPTKKRRNVEMSENTVFQPCLQMMADSRRGTTLKEKHTALPWQAGLRRGTALEEDNDTILVKEEGFYFVYSQVYYTDRTFAMGHFVIRWKKNIVGDELQEVILFRCIQNMNPDFPFNTCYTAGIVKLEAGDRVELLIPRQSANVSLDGDSTFLGAIKLA